MSLQHIWSHSYTAKLNVGVINWTGEKKPQNWEKFRLGVSTCCDSVCTLLCSGLGYSDKNISVRVQNTSWFGWPHVSWSWMETCRLLCLEMSPGVLIDVQWCDWTCSLLFAGCADWWRHWWRSVEWRCTTNIRPFRASWFPVWKLLCFCSFILFEALLHLQTRDNTETSQTKVSSSLWHVNASS